MTINIRSFRQSRLLVLLFTITETLLFFSLLWQTRFDLSHLWPDYFSLPVIADYVRPFIYLSQVLFVCSLLLWFCLYYPRVAHHLRLCLIRFKSYSVTISGSILARPLFWLGLATILTVISFFFNQPHWWNWLWLVNGLYSGLVAIYLFCRFKQGYAWQFVAILCLSAIIQHLLIIYQWLFQSSLGLQWLGEWRTTVYTPGVAKVILFGHEYLRSYGTFAHPNIAGVVLALLWLPGVACLNHIIQLYSTITHRPRLVISLYFIWTSLSFLAIFLTFSRMAWFVAGLHLGCLVLWTLTRSAVRMPLIAFVKAHYIGLIFSLAGLILLSSFIIIPRLTSLTTYDHLSVDRRLQLNYIALQQIYRQPWWGIGLSNHLISLYHYGPLYGVGIWRQPVHNIYLLAAAQIGLPATIAWLMAVLTALRSLAPPIRSKRQLTPITAWLYVAWLSLAIVGLFDHFWLTIYPAILVIPILLAATLYLNKKARLPT